MLFFLIFSLVFYIFEQATQIALFLVVDDHLEKNWWEGGVTSSHNQALVLSLHYF